MSTTGEAMSWFLMLGGFITFGIFLFAVSVLFPHDWRG